MSYIESLFSLKGKIALVTGAARGNGKAISEALLKAGASVILVDILKKELENTVQSLKNENLDTFMCHADITKNSGVKKIRQFIIDKFKRIDILVNNAAVTFPSSIFDYSDDLWDKTYEVNLKAPFRLSRELGKIMKENKSGVIINITSINAEIAFPDNPAYVTFKGGLKQLSKSLALDLGKYGIRVNCIGPGYFVTDMTKKSWNSPILRKKREEQTILKRWGNPEELGGLVIFLCSDSSSYITGQDFYIDGGWLAKGLSSEN